MSEQTNKGGGAASGNGAHGKSQDFAGRGGATKRADFDGNAAEGAERSPRRRVHKSKFQQESEQAKLNKSKLRMGKQGDKLAAAREKLAAQKPVKKPGPVKRAGRVVKGEAHAFVHGKIYEAENDNVGVEAAHRTELAAEAGIRRGTRFIKKRIRQHPARAVRRAESKNIKAAADYQYRVAARDNPDLSNKNALARYWQKQRQKSDMRKLRGRAQRPPRKRRLRRKSWRRKPLLSSSAIPWGRWLSSPVFCCWSSCSPVWPP